MTRPFVQIPQGNIRLARWLPHAATAIGVLVALVGAGHLVAWLSGYMAQRGFSSITMKTNTALCLLLLGVGLALLVPSQAGSVRRWAGRGLAAIASMIGLLSLGENLFGWDLCIDQLLAKEPSGAMGVAGPNLMGTPAAANIVLAGLAILILSRRDNRGSRGFQWLAIAASLIALLGTIGFLYGAHSLNTIVRLTGIAWQTAVALLVLSLGLLLARPKEGLMAQVTADDAGGANLRRWLPVILMPVVLGWLRVVGENNGWFNAATGTAIMMVIFVVALSVLAYTGAMRVSRSSADLQRQREWLRVTLSSIGDAVLATDTAGKITFLNPVAESLTGWREQDAQGRPAQDVFRIINEQTRQQADDIVARVLREGVTVALANHTAIQARDGREIPIEDSAAPIKDAAGKTTGVVLVFHDVTQKRRAEERLRASEELLRAVTENTSDPIFVKDRHSRLLMANPATVAAMGKPAAEIIGKTDAEVYANPEIARAIMDADRRIMESGVSESVEETIDTPAGRRVFLSTKTPRRDGEGRVIGLIGVSRDITERKAAEAELHRHRQHLEELVQERTAELRTSEQEFRSLAESMPQIVWATRPDGWNLYFNHQWVDYTGMTMEESYGHGWNTPFHPDDKQRAWEAWQRATKHNEPYSLECRLRRADGVYRWWLVRGSPMLGPNGEILKWFGTCTDIEELKHSEAALKEGNDLLEQRVAERTAALRLSEEKFALAFASNAAAIAITRLEDGRFLDVNDTWLAVNGYRREEVIGGSARAMGIWPSAEAAGRFVAELKANGSVRGWEQEFRKKSGEVFLAQLSAALLTVQGDKLILSTLVDITDRKRAEEALQRTVAELERSNRELEQFAYISSHDLQEPLRQVRAFVDLLQERDGDKLDGKSAQYMQYIHEGATRMSSLVQGLLTYSRVGAHDRTREPVSCQHALDTALADLQVAMAQAGARVTHDELPTVIADPLQLTMLFGNLIGNALKFRRDGQPPEIHVAARRDGEDWVLSVRDNGIGIAPEFHEKVFQIFQRLHGREKYAGTGIGLAICKKIVEQHGGRIWIDSAAGEGATFHFVLGRAGTPPLPAGQAAKSEA